MTTDPKVYEAAVTAFLADPGFDYRKYIGAAVDAALAEHDRLSCAHRLSGEGAPSPVLSDYGELIAQRQVATDALRNRDVWKGRAEKAEAALSDPSRMQGMAGSVLAAVAQAAGVFMGDYEKADVARRIRRAEERAEKAEADLAAARAGAAEVVAKLQDTEKQRHETLMSFKNFHRSLCDRFGCHHDRIDWRRDQVSLEEHIAKQLAAAQATIADFQRRFEAVSALHDEMVEKYKAAQATIAEYKASLSIANDRFEKTERMLGTAGATIATLHTEANIQAQEIHRLGSTIAGHEEETAKLRVSLRSAHDQADYDQERWEKAEQALTRAGWVRCDGEAGWKPPIGRKPLSLSVERFQLCLRPEPGAFAEPDKSGEWVRYSDLLAWESPSLKDAPPAPCFPKPTAPESAGKAGPTPREVGDIIIKANQERDRAVGAVLLMAWDSAITMSRAAELLSMTVMQIRAEARRLLDKPDEAAAIVASKEAK